MFSRFIGIRVVIILIVALAVFGYWWKHRQPPQPIGIAHIADREVILWNTLAQVREPVAELHYGDRVEVLRREGPSAQLRTAAGVLGWLPDAHQMMDAPIWQQSIDLLARARTMTPQARGRTKTVSNIRVAPGRNGDRIFQFLRGTPVVVLGRQVAEAPQAGEEGAAAEKNADADDQKSKQEDWLFVMSTEETAAADQSALPAAAKKRSSANPVSNGDRVDQTLGPGGLPPAPIAGWVLARFIDLDLPGPVKDYVNAADLRVVAWFELNRVPDGSGGEAPQYLVAGSRGGEGQPCDFTLLRVYTWGAKRHRYETAFVESDLCGRLPIHVASTAGMPEFRFADTDDNSADRIYVMRQTEVQRVKEPSTRSKSPRS
jgi:hypothetical protein